MPRTPQKVPSQLFLRLLMPYPATRHRGQVYLEQLPDELPIEIPLPERSQITASLRQEQSLFTILMQVPQSPLLILSWYSNRLRILGWHQWPSEDPFMDCPVFGVNPSRRNESPRPQLTFCYRPQSLMLTIQTHLVSDNLTGIKLKLYAEQAFHPPCQANWERNLYNLLPLPQLVSPPNTDIRFRRRSGSNFDWYSGAEIQTSLSGSTLLAHYNTQLAQAGWTQQVSEAQEGLLWSIWTLHDQHNQVWQMCLSFVPDSFRSNQYVASLQGLNLNELSARSRVYTESINPPVPESISEDLLWQLLSDSFSPEQETKRLWIGQLPPTLPSPLRFPENTQVLGGVVEEGQSTNLLLEVPLLPDQICGVLTEQLIGLGWQEREDLNGVENIGFENSQPPRWIFRELFHPTDQLQCLIRLYPTTAGCRGLNRRLTSQQM